MRKLKVLFAVILMGVCVNVMAFIPAALKDEASATTVQQGNTITISTSAVSGTAVGMHTYFGYNETVLDFVSFETDYDFTYDIEQKAVVSENGLDLSGYNLPLEVWTITFRVKDDAQVGETIINDQTYSIVEKSEDTDDEIIANDDTESVVDESIENQDNDINIFLITTIALGVIALIELVYIIVKKNKKA